MSKRTARSGISGTADASHAWVGSELWGAVVFLFADDHGCWLTCWAMSWTSLARALIDSKSLVTPIWIKQFCWKPEQLTRRYIDWMNSSRFRQPEPSASSRHRNSSDEHPNGRLTLSMIHFMRLSSEVKNPSGRWPQAGKHKCDCSKTRSYADIFWSDKIWHLLVGRDWDQETVHFDMCAISLHSVANMNMERRLKQQNRRISIIGRRTSFQMVWFSDVRPWP